MKGSCQKKKHEALKLKEMEQVLGMFEAISLLRPLMLLYESTQDRGSFYENI